MHTYNTTYKYTLCHIHACYMLCLHLRSRSHQDTLRPEPIRRFDHGLVEQNLYSLPAVTYKVCRCVPDMGT